MYGMQVGLAESANHFGIPVEQLLTWWRAAETFGVLDVFKGVAKGNLANAFEATARMALAHLTPHKLEKASAKDILAVADVAMKNANLLRGQPTEIRKTIDEQTVTALRTYVEKYGVDKAREKIGPLIGGETLAAFEAAIAELTGNDVVTAKLASEVEQ